MITATTASCQTDSNSARSSRAASLLFAQPLGIALLAVAILTAIHARSTVDADVAWQLWIGRQLNHGAHFYSDIIDTNPPLWFWMAMPLDRLSVIMHVRSDHLLILVMGCTAALSLFATDRLIGPMAPLRRTLFLAYASMILVAMPWLEVGQREHIALIGTLPYAALIAARRCERPVPTGLAVATALFAALGFALKHYFLVVPLFLETWLVAAQKKSWRPVRPETAAIASVGIAYAAAMLVFAQHYLTDVVPVLLLAYGATGAKHVADLFQPAVLAGLACIMLLLSPPHVLRRQRSALATSLTIAAIGFTAVYFMQSKGWSYHAVPMLGCSAMALAASLIERKLPKAALLIAPALLFLPFTIEAQLALREPASEADVTHAVAGLHRGDNVGFIASDPSFGWHVVLQRGLNFSLRYNGFWMMQAVVSNELRGSADPRLTELGRRVVRQTVADFECRPPRRIIVARPSPEASRAGEFDILAFFMRDPQFARLLAHYRPVERSSIETFELQSPLEPGRNCPSWSPA